MYSRKKKKKQTTKKNEEQLVFWSVFCFLLVFSEGLWMVFGCRFLQTTGRRLEVFLAKDWSKNLDSLVLHLLVAPWAASLKAWCCFSVFKKKLAFLRAFWFSFLKIKKLLPIVSFWQILEDLWDFGILVLQTLELFGWFLLYVWPYDILKDLF